MVWEGRAPGVYDTWAECERQTAGHAGARFKSFGSRGAAEAAFAEDASSHVDYSGAKAAGERGDRAGAGASGSASAARPADYPVGPALCVDAACNGRTWEVEYRGVWLGGERDGEVAFSAGPFRPATGNLGEFLALVAGLRLQVEDGDADAAVVFTDSLTARAWVRDRKVKSQRYVDRDADPLVLALVDDALRWLESARPGREGIRGWDTKRWGEIPADYGRK